MDDGAEVPRTEESEIDPGLSLPFDRFPCGAGDPVVFGAHEDRADFYETLG